jgi:hypothetical protein
MRFVIINRAKKSEFRDCYYAGFIDGWPHWIKTRHPSSALDRDEASEVHRQLTELGFTVEIEPVVNEHARLRST